MKLKPHYSHNPIASIEALATTLGIHPKLLQDLANKVDDSYTDFISTSKNRKGEIKDRNVCEPKHELKKLQKRINARIFEKVEYPDYLQGGIKDETSPRDYVVNATRHAHANQIICIDVKQFYPSIKSQYVAKIFQYFFKFSPAVSEILTKLVTYHGRVPQGGCTSSYRFSEIKLPSPIKILKSPIRICQVKSLSEHINGSNNPIKRTIGKTTGKFVNRIKVKKCSSIPVNNGADFVRRRVSSGRSCKTVGRHLQNRHQLDFKVHVRGDKMGDG